jgi:hypothetical protein
MDQPVTVAVDPNEQSSDHESEATADNSPAVSLAPDRTKSETIQFPKNVSISDAEPAHSFRGPLRYEVDTSSPQLSAGQRFSIFVRITNPYDVPVTIRKVECTLPAEFRDENQVKSLNPIKRYLKGLFLKQLQLDEPNIVLGRSVSDREAETSLDPEADIVLQPGNTSLRRFTVRTWQRNMFSPGSYTLHFVCQYEMEGTLNTDATKQPFALRAPISAMIWGSVWGAICGVVLRFLNLDHTDKLWSTTGFLSALAAGLVLAAVLVVAFARKKDVQPFIAIEDFWGGFFVGFVAGFQGISVLHGVLPTPAK